MGAMTTSAKLSRSPRTAALAALALAVGAVAGCSSDDGTPTSDATATAATDASATPSDDATDDGGFTAGPGGPSEDTTVHTAIETAIAQMDGSRAFDLEHEDDGNAYEIDVTDGTTVTEVRISSDGTSVQRTETDDLDGDDQRELEAATVEMAEAVDIALGEQGGLVTDVELDTENDVVIWEVQVRASDDVEHDVDIDAASGDVLKVDTDR